MSAFCRSNAMTYSNCLTPSGPAFSNASVTWAGKIVELIEQAIDLGPERLKLFGVGRHGETIPSGNQKEP